MSKVKLLLDVVEDLRSLADSVQAVADAMLQNEPTVDAKLSTCRKKSTETSTALWI